jgi:hypothetical protein
MSNAFCGDPFGILLDAPGMQAYTGTWAALAKVKPTRRSHVMVGVYNGDPEMRNIDHHGVDLSLRGPVFVIGEVGYRFNGLPGDRRGSAITNWVAGMTIPSSPVFRQE